MRAHRRAYDFRIERVGGAWREQYTIHARRPRRAQNRAEVARVAQGVEDEQKLRGARKGPVGKRIDRDEALRRLGFCQRVQHIRADRVHLARARLQGGKKSLRARIGHHRVRFKKNKSGNESRSLGFFDDARALDDELALRRPVLFETQAARILDLVVRDAGNQRIPDR